MWKHILISLAFFVSFSAHAACQGIGYLNPQTIKGEGTEAAGVAQQELARILSGSGLTPYPNINIKRVADVRRYSLSESITSPCVIYSNPVIGFAAGDKYVPLVVNMDLINPVVVFFGKPGDVVGPKPKRISDLPPDRQTEIRNLAKDMNCHGMHAGVTTAIIYGQKLCKVEELVASQGSGQSYLPTKVAFAYKTGIPIGLITRDASAMRVDVSKILGVSQDAQRAELIVIPAGDLASWGYGVYIHQDTPVAVKAKILVYFQGITSPSKELRNVLDTDEAPVFRQPTPDEARYMKSMVLPYLSKKE